MIQQDMKIKCLVSNKFVNFASRDELEKTIDDPDMVDNLNQEELIRHLVFKLSPTKKQDKQLSLMSSNTAWKDECKDPDCAIHDIFVKTQLEKRKR